MVRTKAVRGPTRSTVPTRGHRASGLKKCLVNCGIMFLGWFKNESESPLCLPGSILWEKCLPFRPLVMVVRPWLRVNPFGSLIKQIFQFYFKILYFSLIPLKCNSPLCTLDLTVNLTQKLCLFCWFDDRKKNKELLSNIKLKTSPTCRKLLDKMWLNDTKIQIRPVKIFAEANYFINIILQIDFRP